MFLVLFAMLECSWAGQAEDQAYVVDFCTVNPGTCTSTITYCDDISDVGQYFNCNDDGLIISHTHAVDGAIPTTIGRVTNLLDLVISRVGSVAYSLPSQIGQLTALTALFLDAPSIVQLTGTIPTELGQLHQLKRFTVLRHMIDPGVSLPTEIGAGWSSIETFFVETFRMIGGTIPAAIGPGWRDSIKSFVIQDSKFGFIELPRLSHAPHLHTYHVTDNDGDITYDDPLLFSSPALVSARFERNQNLHGTIPSVSFYGHSKPLEFFTIDSNGVPGISFQLTPSISLFNQTLLEFSLVNQPNIGGTLPAELATLTVLSALRVKETGIVSTIPSELASLTALTNLHLVGNPVFSCDPPTTLHGTFPAELANMISGPTSQLSILDLRGTCFTGTIPGSMLQNANLLSGIVTITGTSFTDPLPSWLTEIARNRAAPDCLLTFNRFCHVPRPYTQSELLCPISFLGTIDACGVCEGVGDSCLDCAGVQHGSGVVDLCGVCNGDSRACLDCNGVPFGTTQFDECNVCGGSNECQDCSGSTTGSLSYDRCGVCGGNGQSCVDCHGVLFGTSVIDACNVCGGEGRTCTDCGGTVNGSKLVDDCGLCADVRSESYRPQCFDCTGTANGTQIRDICGGCPASLRCDPGDIAFRGLLLRFSWVWWLILILLLISVAIVLIRLCITPRPKQP